MNVYPKNGRTTSGRNNIAIQVYGDRIHIDQTLYEYLIEFLLVFSSIKNIEDKTGSMEFHKQSDSIMNYYVYPRIGLKRFIFFDRAKKNLKIDVDEKAYHLICEMLKKSVNCNDQEQAKEVVEAIQDLLHGYAAVLKNRSWCAQALLPICPELIFCEEMPLDQERAGLQWDTTINDSGFSDEMLKIETCFDGTRHNFLARGGEVYYLHILQGLEACEDTTRIKLEKGLRNLLTAQNKNFSSIANWIQGTWEREMHLDTEKLVEEKRLEFIPATGYINCAQKTIDELITFLSNEMHPIMRIEILAKGVVFQIMRMMCERTSDYLGKGSMPWIVDMRSKKSGNTVMHLSAESFKNIEEAFVCAINKRIVEFREENNGDLKDTPYKYLTEARKKTLDVFRKLGKEMQCIIPSNGGMERFSLSEDIVKFLVLSIIKPGDKMTIDIFLKELFKHYSLVIGPEQYKAACACEAKMDIELTNCFMNNMKAFQDFLKNTGFLRDLSDATSIVVNPFTEVTM